MPPVPRDTPPAAPRLLHAAAERFGVLQDGAVLVSPRSGEPLRLDPATGATTPWTLTWSPDPAWKLAPDGGISGGAPEPSPDGAWVVVSRSWQPARPPVPRAILVTAYVVARHDGSDPRCVGLVFTEDEQEPPTTAWIPGPTRLTGGWTAECTPDAAGRPRLLERSKALRTHDPAAGASSVYPVTDLSQPDPQGHLALVHDYEREPPFVGLLDLRTATTLRTLPEADDELLWPGGWVAPDAVLLNTHRDGKLVAQRVLFADGRDAPAPTPTWRHYARLADGEHLFTRDAGATLEQGRVDWTRLQVESSRPRPDLQPLAGRFDQTGQTSFTPIAAGILVHVPLRGTLLLAPL